MNKEKIIEGWRKGKFSSLYFFSGEDRLAKEKAIALLRQKMFKDGGEDFNVRVFRGGEEAMAEILDLARTLPMMAAMRLLVIKDVDACSLEELKDLDEYLGHCTDTACIVFVVELKEKDLKRKQKSNKRLSILQEIRSRCQEVDFSLPTERQLPQEIKKILKSEGKTISQEALEILLEAVGRDTGKFYAEMEKLLVYGEGRKRIEAEDVEGAVAEGTLRDIFQLTDAVAGKDLPGALRVFQEMIRQGESPIGILPRITWQLRQIWLVREGLDLGLDTDEIARRTKMHPFVFKKVMRQAKNFQQGEIKRAFGRLLEMDEKMKTSAIDRNVALESFLIDLCR